MKRTKLKIRKTPADIGLFTKTERKYEVVEFRPLLLQKISYNLLNFNFGLHVKKLRIDEHIKVNDLLHIVGQMNNIEVLEVEWLCMEEFDEENFPELRNLKKLDIMGYGIDFDNVVPTLICHHNNEELDQETVNFANCALSRGWFSKLNVLYDTYAMTKNQMQLVVNGSAETARSLEIFGEGFLAVDSFLHPKLNLESMKFDYLNRVEDEELFCKFLEQNKNLKYINRIFVSDLIFGALTKYCTQLDFLYMEYVHMIQKPLALTASNWKKLKHLQIGSTFTSMNSSPPFETICFDLPNLEVLELYSIGFKREDILAITEKFQNLKKLLIHKCCGIDDNSVNAIFERLTNLEDLSLKGNYDVSEMGLCNLKNLKKIRRLTISGNFEISKSCIRNANLKKLKSYNLKSFSHKVM